MKLLGGIPSGGGDNNVRSEADERSEPAAAAPAPTQQQAETHNVMADVIARHERISYRARQNCGKKR